MTEVILEVEGAEVAVSVDEVTVDISLSGMPGPPGGSGPAGPPGPPGGHAIVQPTQPTTTLTEGTIWVDSDSDTTAGGGGGGGTTDLNYVGAYDPGTTYGDGDIVIGSDGLPYLAVVEGITTPPEPWTSGAGLQTRSTASTTSPALNAGQEWAGTIALANGYRLYHITTSNAARVRLYTTAAKQTADASRPIGTDPIGDHGVMLEFVTTASLLSADLSPVVDGFDGKTTPDGAIPISVTNTGTGSTTVTVTFLWLRTE